MAVVVPNSKMGVIIGKIGETIVEHYFKKNGIIILSRQFEVPYIGAKADFVVTKNVEKIEQFKKVWLLTPWKDNNNKNILKEIKIPFMSRKDIKIMIEETYLKHPEAGITYLGNNRIINLYNLAPCSKEHYDFIKDNFCLVEVKSCLGDKYPVMRKRSLTTTQKVYQYYDVLLRVKIEKNLENGFTGTIHPKDLEQLNNNHKI